MAGFNQFNLLFPGFVTINGPARQNRLKPAGGASERSWKCIGMIDWVADKGSSAGVTVNTATRSALLADVRSAIADKTGFTIATLNLDHVVKLRRSKDFLQAYQAHSHVVADGNPIVWMSRLAQRPVELVPGSELIVPLSELALEEGVSVAFFGSSQEALDAAAAGLVDRVPGLEIAARISPQMGFDPESAAADAFLDQIEASGASICFLALGAPKQEILAARAAARGAKCGFVSIGAGLDFIAGRQVRAPEWMRKAALEWLWRLSSNPRRLFVRYFECAMILPALTIEALRARRLSTAASEA